MKILAIGAHPDDIEYYAGGTLAQKASKGDEVIFLVATDGRYGTHQGISEKDLIEIRRREQELAARKLGATKVIYLNYPDGELENNVWKLKEDLLKVILMERPKVVFSFDPQKQYMIHDDFHPDHRTLAVAVLDLLLIDSTLPSKVEEPLGSVEVFLYNAYQVNQELDISDYLEQKLEALGAFKSQLEQLVILDKHFERFWVYTRK